MVSKEFHGKPYAWIADFELKSDANLYAKSLKKEGYITEIAKGGYKGKEWELYARPK
jgi:hypothetical protein